MGIIIVDYYLNPLFLIYLYNLSVLALRVAKYDCTKWTVCGNVFMLLLVLLLLI